MNTMNMPGFTAEIALFGSGSQHHVYRGGGHRGALKPQVVTIAESVPGGPSTVPSGYNRTCKRVPYTICVGNRCWIEYGWVCTYRPLPRVQ